jgi:hypothetical protein
MTSMIVPPEDLKIDRVDIVIDEYEPPACDRCQDEPPELVLKIGIPLDLPDEQLIMGAYCRRCATIVIERLRSRRP